MSGKPNNNLIKTKAYIKVVGILFLGFAFGLVCVPQVSYSNPQGGSVAAGNIQISNPSSDTVQINQSSQKGIINWQSYNIAPNERVNYQQPNASSITLNRINPNSGVSQIFGTIKANGQIWLVNPAGIWFGPTAHVDVAGLIATTAGISDQDFLAGHYHFVQSPDWNGAVVNEGYILVSNAGLVALAGPGVVNNGHIEAQLGTVVLASGQEYTVDFRGDHLINFTVSGNVTKAAKDPRTGKSMSNAIENSGTVIADGGKVLMTASTAGSVLDGAINMSGIAEAKSVSVKNGEIILHGGEGATTVSGKLIASGKNKGEKGGTIKVLGDKVILTDKAVVDVSGKSGGGEVLIGGNYQGKGKEQNARFTYFAKDAVANADALDLGDGGKVIVWADLGTGFYGNIFARGGAEGGNGGFVEVSGKGGLDFNGIVNTQAPNGSAGMLLLDPKFLIVAATGGSAYSAGVNNLFANNSSGTNTITPASINAAGNVTLQANSDVIFSDPLSMTGTLTVNAGRSILINANIVSNNKALSFTANDASATAADRSTTSAGNPSGDTETTAGNITMASGTSIDPGGNSNVTLTIGSTATGNFSPGSMILYDIKRAGILSITSPNAVTFNGVVGGTAALGGNSTISANTSSGSSGVTFNNGSSITLNNKTLAINVNATGGGTGGVSFDTTSGTNITSGGQTVTIATNVGGNTTGGSITQIGTTNSSINTGGGGVTLSVPTASSSSIGTSGTKIKTTSTGTLTLTAGSGGAFVSNTGNITLAAPVLNANSPLTVLSSGVLTLPNSAISTGTGSIDLESNGGALSTVQTLTTTSGNITLVGSGLLTVADNLTTTGGTISLTGTGVTQSNAIQVSSGTGTINVSAGTGTLTMNANSRLLSGNAGGTAGLINITADNVALNTSGTPSQVGGTGAGTGAAATVIIQPTTAGSTINIVAAGGTLNLTQAELNDIQATNVRIGNTASGLMTINAWTPDAEFAPGVLTLASGGGISQGGVINLATSTSDLLIRGAGTVSLGSANVFNNIAASKSGNSLSITNAATNPLTVTSLTDDLGTVNGITAPGGVTLTTSGAGGSLTVNQGIDSSGSNGNISLSSVGITQAASTTIQSGTGTISINAGGGAANFNTGAITTTNATVAALTIRNATTVALGNITAASGTFTLGVADISGAVTQTSGTTIAANTFTASTTNSINLGNTTNDFGTISTITRGGALTIKDTNALTVTGPITSGTITNPVTIAAGLGGAGLLTINGNIFTSGANDISLSGVGITQNSLTTVNAGSGNLTYNAGSGTLTTNTSNLLLTSGIVTLIADDMVLDISILSQIGGTALGVGNASNAILTQSTNNRDIFVATSGTGLSLSAAELNTVNAIKLRIGNSNAGAMTIGTWTPLQAYSLATGTLDLSSGNGMSQTGPINLALFGNLIIGGNGDALLTNSGNLFSNIAVNKPSGAVSITNLLTNPLTVTSLTDDIGTVTGISSPGGVTLNASGVGGSITVNQNITTTNNAVSLTGNAITVAANKIINSGSGSITANADTNSLTLNSGSQLLSTGAITLIADTMAFNTSGTPSQIGGTGTGTGFAAFAILQPSSINQTIGIAGGAGSLQLTAAALNDIRATKVHLGSGTSGNMAINAWTPAANFANNGVLTLQTGGTITQGGAINLATSNAGLLLRSSVGVTLTSNNVVSNIAANIAGALSFTNAATNPLTVTTLVDDVVATSGITAPGGVSLTTSGAGGSLSINQNISATNNAISLAGTGITVAASKVVNGGSGTLTANAGANTLTLNSNSQLLGTGTINLTADTFTFDTSSLSPSQVGGTGSAAGNAATTILQPSTASRTIGIAGGTGSLQLTEAVLNDVRSTNVRIGNNAAGTINIAAWTPGANFATGVLTLNTASVISQSGAINLATSTSDLLIRNATDVVLTNSNNVFSNIAASHSAGALSITNASTNPLVVTALTDDLGTVSGITAPGGVTLNTSGVGGSLTINQNISTTNSPISLTGTGITVAANKIVNGGSGTLTANAGANTLTLNSGSQLLGTGTINLTADTFAFDTSILPSQVGGTGTGTGNATNTILKPSTASRTIGIAGGTGNLQLTEALLNDVRSTNVRIGSSTAGAINIAAWTPGANFATGVLTLDTAGTVTQSGAINLATSTSDLLIRDATGVTLNTNNVFANIAASLASGSLSITNAATNPLVVTSLTDDMGTVSGITASGGVSLTASGAGGSLSVNQNITATNNAISLSGSGISLAASKVINGGSGTLTANAGANTLTLNSGSQLLGTGTINLTADTFTFDTSGTPSQVGGTGTGTGNAATAILQTSTAGRTIGIAGGTGSLQLTQAALNDVRATNVRIGNSSAGNINSGAWTPTANFATGVLTLDTAGTVTQSGAINLSTSTSDLLIRDASGITLNSANIFQKIAAAASGSISITSAASLPLTVSSLTDDIGTLNGVTSSTNSVTLNATNAGIVLNAPVTAGTTGNSIVLAGQSFTNNNGASALNPGSGNFLVWSGDPANDNRGGLAYNFKQYNATFGVTSVLGTGNGFLYTVAPVVTPVLTGTVSKVFNGTTAATLAAANYTSTGVIDNDTVTFNNPTSGTYDNKNVGTNKNVSVSGIAIASATDNGATVYGYQLGSSTANANIGTITAAPLTVTSNTGQTKIYGNDDPGSAASAYSLTSGTLFGLDALTGSMGRVSGETVGNYNFTQNTVTVSDGNSGNNYAITFNGSTNPFSITARSLTASIANQSKVYGANDPTLSGIAVTLGNVVNRNVTDINGNVTAINNTGNVAITLASLTRDAGEVVSSSPYAITASTFNSLTGSAAGNYSAPTALTGSPTLTISKANLTGSIANQSKVYGADDPALSGISVTLGGVINRTVSTWNGNVSVNDTGNVATTLASLTRDAGELVSGSPYAITAATFNSLTGSAAGNYNAPSFTGSPILTITKKSLTGSIANQSKVYGADDPALSGIGVTLGGVVNRTISTWNGNVSVNDTGNVATTLASLTRDAGELVSGSPYAITAATFNSLTGSAAGNYNAPSFTGSPILTITKKSLTGSIASQSKTYGTNDPSISGIGVTLGGVVNRNVSDWNGNSTSINDTGNVATTLASLTRDAGELVSGSPYAITAATFNSLTGSAVGNYNAPTFTGSPTLTISKANLTGSIANQSKVYGADDPALSGIGVTLGGIVNTSVTDWNGNNTAINDTGNVATTLASLTRDAGELVSGSPYAITAATFNSLTGSAAGNYNAPSFTGSPILTITKKSLTGSIANQSKVYGADDPALSGIGVTLGGVINTNISTWNGNVSVNDTGNVATTLASLTRDAGELVSGSPYAITAATFNSLTGSAAGNYNALSFTGSPILTITKKSLTGSIASQSKTYGTNDPSISGIGVTLGGVVNRNVSDWNGNSTSINDTGNVATTLASLTRDAGELVSGSPYAITAATFNSLTGSAIGNYNAPTFTGSPTLTISKANLTGSIANQSKVYGADDPALSGIGVTLGGVVNRTISTWNGNVSVNDTGNVATTLASLTRDAGELVSGSPYTITAATFNSLTGSAAGNYNTPSFTGSPILTITKKSLTGSIANQSKIYGADDPALSGIGVTLGGVVNRTISTWNGNVSVNDTGNVATTLASLTRDAGELVSGSPYAITAATFNSLTGSAAGNYNAPSFTGSPILTITKKSLTGSIANQSKVYGADDPALSGISVTLGGVVNRNVSDWNGNSTSINDTGNVATTLASLTRDAGEFVSGSPYAITAATFNSLTGSAVGNYNAPTFTGSPTLTISKANLTGSIANQSKVYGADDPALSGIGVTLGGVVNRTISTWNGNVSVNDTGNVATTLASLTRDAGELVSGSPYAITAATFNSLTGSAAGNYNAPSFTGSPILTITKESLTGSIANQSKIYGADDPALSGIGVTLGGVVNRTISTWNGNVNVNDTGNVATTLVSLTRDAGELVSGSPYAITAATFNSLTGSAAGNYNAPTFTGSPTLTISKANLTGSIANQSKVYGADDPALPGISVTLGGAVNRTVSTWNGNVSINDTGNVVTTLASLTRDVGELVSGSPYAITAATFNSLTGSAAGNYNAPSFTGSPTLTINKANLTGSIANQSKVYGNDDPALSGIGVTLGGVINRTISTWNGNVSVNDTGNVATTLASLTRDVGELVSGSPYAITAGAFNSLTGSAAGNYNAPSFIGTPNLTIVKKSLTGSIANQSKVYGNNDPSISGISVTLGGVVNRTISTWNGNVSINDTGNVATTLASLVRNAGELVSGSPYAITAANFNNITGSAAGNYNNPTLTGSPTLTITKANLTGSIANQSKVYGSNDPSLPGIGVTLGGVVNTTVTDWNGNNTAINDTGNVVATLASLTRNVGELVNDSPYVISAATFNVLSGSASGNYNSPSFVGTPTLTITPKSLTASIDNVVKVYGTNDPVASSISVILNGIVNNSAINTWNGIVSVSDAGNVNITLASYTRVAGENVNGSPYAFTSSVLNGLTGSAASNYSAPVNLSGSPTLSIIPASLTAVGVIANDKIHDGNTIASLTLNSAILIGVLPGDAVTISPTGYIANFISANAGLNIPVTVRDLGLEGAASGNYILIQPSNLTANIFPDQIPPLPPIIINVIDAGIIFPTNYMTSDQSLTGLKTTIQDQLLNDRTHTFSNKNIARGCTLISPDIMICSGG